MEFLYFGIPLWNFGWYRKLYNRYRYMDTSEAEKNVTLPRNAMRTDPRVIMTMKN